MENNGHNRPSERRDPLENRATDRFRNSNEMESPSRYRREEPYYGNLSEYDRSFRTPFPESGANRDMRGVHSGKGPRNYARSDDRIREIVCDRLCDDPYVDASDIDVQVNNCEVILSGTVENRASKRRAEEVVERLRFVTHVENRLRVNAQVPKGGAVGNNPSEEAGQQHRQQDQTTNL